MSYINTATTCLGFIFVLNMWFEHLRIKTFGPLPKSSDGTLYLRRGMRYGGLNPTKKFKNIYHVWIGCTVAFGLGYLPMSYLFALKISAEMSTSEFLTLLTVALNGWSGPIRLIFLLRHKSRLFKANDLLDGLDKHCERNPLLRKGIRRVAVLGNRIFVTFFICYEAFVVLKLATCMYLVKPMLFLYNPWVHYYVGADRKTVLQQTATDFVILQYGICIEMMIDVYATIYVAHLREHLKLLRIRVQLLDEKDEERERYGRLIECVKDHKTLLNYCELLRPLMSSTTLLQFMVCGSALGIAVINMIFFADIMTSVANFPYLLLIILQTFPLAYLCNCVLDEGQELCDAIFHTNWMYEDLKYKKVVLFFLHSVQKQSMEFYALIFLINLNTNITCILWPRLQIWVDYLKRVFPIMEGFAVLSIFTFSLTFTL